MSIKNHKRTGENIVHTIRSGAVIADILRGTTSDGHAYLYYQTSRAWRPISGLRENFSQRFYERNERDHVMAVQKASLWIRKNPRAADDQSSTEATTQESTEAA